MPAGPAEAPFRWPFRFVRFAGFRFFPQHEIQRILLRLIDCDTFAGTQFVERFSRQFSIPRKLPHSKIHITIGGVIGQAFGFECFDNRLHFFDVLRRAWLVLRRLDTQRGCVFVHEADEAFRQIANCLAIFLRTLNDIVFDIRNITHIGHVKTGNL